MRKSYLYVIVGILLLSCNETRTVERTTPEESKVSLTLLENNCYACHSPSASAENRVAPPMEGVKRHYLTEGLSKEEFTKRISDFLANPSNENAKLKKAVKRFGLMPKMNFTDQQITQMANYMYTQELEKPSWFEKHFAAHLQKPGNETEVLTPLKQGQRFAMQTKKVLGKNLMGVLNSKGTLHALSFCSSKAYPLVDSMSLVLGAKIKRVSDKNRNPENEANAQELAYILEAKELLQQGKEIKPLLSTINGKDVGYYPIMTNKMCMQCHGEQQIKPSTKTLLAKLYPKDKAVNYKEKQLRGIWVVEMDKK